MACFTCMMLPSHSVFFSYLRLPLSVEPGEGKWEDVAGAFCERSLILKWHRRTRRVLFSLLLFHSFFFFFSPTLFVPSLLSPPVFLSFYDFYSGKAGECGIMVTRSLSSHLHLFFLLSAFLTTITLAFFLSPFSLFLTTSCF